MKRRSLLYLLFSLLALGAAVLPAVSRAEPRIQAIPVQDADVVFEVTTELSSELDANLAELHHPCAVQAGDWVACADLILMPEALRSALDVLPGRHAPPHASDWTLWRDFAAPPGALSSLLDGLPARYAPAHASD
jgi:hypothetical protein